MVLMRKGPFQGAGKRGGGIGWEMYGMSKLYYTWHPMDINPPKTITSRRDWYNLYKLRYI